MRLKVLGISIFCVLFFGSCGWHVPQDIDQTYQELPDQIDFNFHVKPILSDKCFACHGPDLADQKAGLRLDLAEEAYGILESGNRAIVPGKPHKSAMVYRILSKDKEQKMPPPEFILTLSSKEKAILAKWIKQGAEYKQHWSFIEPEKPELPKIKNTEWSNNEIDFFVANKLQLQNLAPSDRATKETLIRRLSFDLTGLPPSLGQIEDFVADTSNNAYEKLVDQLLASPAYGERMAAEWMDVARFADSDGYLDDKHRDFSPYRDWVIKAFNENLSYEKFATWQLAGDLIPEPTQESILATAFNRLHKKNSEAGIIFEEYRQEYIADRTLTTGKAFMALSVECARCHDHKYDAISQKEHYEMAAFFNSTNEIGTAVYGPGQAPGPSLLLTNNEQEEVLEYIDKNIQKAEKRLVEVKSLPFEAKQSEKENSQNILKYIAENYWNKLEADYSFDKLVPQGNKKFIGSNSVLNAEPVSIKEPDIKKGVKNNGIFLNDYTTIKLPKKVGWFDQTDPFTVSISIFPDINYEEAGLFYHCEDIRLGLNGYSLFLENNRPKFILAQSWPTNAIQVKTKNAIPVKEWTNLTISYDGMGKAGGVHIYFNGEEVEVDREIDNLYKSIAFEPDIHTYGFSGFQLGIRNHMKTFIKGGVDELKIHSKELSALEVLYGYDQSRAEKVIENGGVSKNQILISEFYRQMNPDNQRAKEEVRKLKKERIGLIDTIQEIMVMGDLSKPRPTFILDRGMYDAPIEEVFPNIPQAILPFDESLPRNRLGLAKWLFDPEHPLTARVYVNRLWQMHFGKGLVASSDDFGNQGDLPSHPELLDWLAVTFQESGWDIKKMHKQIVMSATYQQSSKVNKELLDIDTDNILLARGPSFRMTAEMVRDNALTISGLLSSKIGGPSVYPYQPEGIWDEISNKGWRYKYLQEPGEGLYRRSLYTIWKRTSAPPSMLIFDVGERGVCTVKRRETSTPLQALVLLNDPQYIEASRVLAENLMVNYKDVNSRLKNGYKWATGRSPEKGELNILHKFYTEEAGRFSKNVEDAEVYVSTGSLEPRKGLNVVDVATLATVMNGIMNTTDGFTIR
jgi:hypothetical protein